MPFLQNHIDQFLDSLNEPYIWPGKAPSVWVGEMGLDNVPQQDELPKTSLTREELREICLDEKKEPLFGYICTMAWGGQDAGKTGKKNVHNAWKERETIKNILVKLRQGNLNRSSAYQLFIENPIAGLGPSFFTKLLFFFSPEPNFYIMDQWTAKSINLLTGKRIVKLYGKGRASPHPSNVADNYEVFCAVIDALGRHINLAGDKVEEKLFSRGNTRRANNSGKWRKHVIKHWENQPYLSVDLPEQLEVYEQYKCLGNLFG